MMLSVLSPDRVSWMSSSSITDPLSAPVPTDRSLSEFVLGPVRRAAFWAAIVLPFLHLPLLVTGLETETATLAFGLLLVLNVCALVVGRPE